MEETINKLKGKRILIWGYGREGKSTEKLLKQYCEPAALDIFEGPREGVHEENYDYVFVSPGIPFEEDAPDYGNRKFTSQTELFLEEYGAQTIGITGTKGKSTTSSMLAAALKEAGKKVFLVGNIGIPCFDAIAGMTEDAVAVFELSCHQCQRLRADPHVAVFLDLYEDHLDRYHTMEHYFAAKCGITRHQKEGDILYVGADVPEIATRAEVRKITPDMAEKVPMRIPGAHNLYNAEFVRRIAVDVCHADPEKTEHAIENFSGLAHRLQYCGERDGITYIDDSISTIPEAAMRALRAVPNAQTLILGGMDRGIEYTALEDFMAAHPEYHYVLCYASGERIARELQGRVPGIFLEKDLEGAVKRAEEVTEKGRAVILSPAAASYGYFKNFEERGDVFRELAGLGKAPKSGI